MATDNQVVASLDTETGALGSGAADGPYTLQGYDPNLDKWFFSDEEGYLYSMDENGTNVEERGQAITGLANGPTGGGPENPMGHIVDGYLYVVGNEGTGGRIDLAVGAGSYQELFNESSDGVQIYFAPDEGTKGVIYWTQQNNDLRKYDLGTDTPTTMSNKTGTDDDHVMTIDPDRVNSDATVGAVWFVHAATVSARKDEIEMHASDSTSAVPNILNTIDLTSGFPDSFNEVIDIEYDPHNDILYLLIDTGSTPAKQIWTLPATESATAADAVLVGDVSDDANWPGSRMVLDFDTYTTISESTIAELSPVLWLDAANALDGGGATPTDGEAVASWPNDGSGSNPTDVNGPIYKTSITNLNSLPAVRFDGVDDFVQLADGTMTWPLTLYIVFETGTGDDWIASFGTRGSGDNTFSVIMIEDAFDNTIDEVNIHVESWGGNVGTQLEFSDTAGQIFMVRDASDQGSGPTFITRVSNPEGSALLGQSDAFPHPDTAGLNSPQVIGARENTLPAVTDAWGGDIAEIIGFNERHSAAQANVVLSELQSKYSLA